MSGLRTERVTPVIDHGQVATALECLTKAIGCYGERIADPFSITWSNGVTAHRKRAFVAGGLDNVAKEVVRLGGKDLRTIPGESVRVAWGGEEERPNDLGMLCTASELSDRCTELARRLVNQGDEVSRLTAERDAAIRERDAARAEAERLSVSQMKAAQERDKAHEARGRIRKEWEQRGKALHIAYGTIGQLKARVAELESALNTAPAANAGGEKQEPVAWGVLMTPGSKVWRCSSEKQAQKCVDHFGTGTVVPLYAAPQPPRGWLTSEERAAVEEAIVDYGSNVGDNECERIERVLRALLARSTPPMVKVPEWMHDDVRRAVVAAIREAGGEVGE